jgi:ubiquinone/menaquinone biosynthesis C-methylase UbiE
MSLDKRERGHEWMDEPGVDPVLLGKSLRYIRGVNRWLGYTRATVSHFERFGRSWERGRRVTVLDVGTGTGDVPAALVRWGDRRGFDVRVVALDLHEATVRAAAGRGLDSRIRLVRGDATGLPFGEGSFDYAMCSMFLHHLDDEVVVRVFREMNRVARVGVVAADLVRDARAVFWIRVLTCLANRMVRHDAVVSVRQAFREGEVVGLARRAGLDYVRYHAHFGHRFVLAGEKGK